MTTILFYTILLAATVNAYVPTGNYLSDQASTGSTCGYPPLLFPLLMGGLIVSFVGLVIVQRLIFNSI
jgi:hypothetical protein